MVFCAAPRNGAWRPLASGVCPAVLAGLFASCLGTGTTRIDAPCHEMQAAVVSELLKDSPTVPIIDVRTDEEVTLKEGRLPRSVVIPIRELPGRVRNLDAWRDKTLVVLGVDGASGRRACELLSAQGFKYVVFVADGAPGFFAGRAASSPPAVSPTPQPTPPVTPTAAPTEVPRRP